MKQASKKVGLRKVNGGNKEHSSEVGMTRDGGALLALSPRGKSETEQHLVDVTSRRLTKRIICELEQGRWQQFRE